MTGLFDHYRHQISLVPHVFVLYVKKLNECTTLENYIERSRIQESTILYFSLVKLDIKVDETSSFINIVLYIIQHSRH